MDMISFSSRFIAVVSLSSAFVLIWPVYGQTPTPTTTCTPSMLTGFTPCMNFLNNNNIPIVTRPSPDCCASVTTLAANGSDCLCQLVTGRSPFQFQINRTLAVFLPRACNVLRVPLQCKAANAPIPAPGPGAFAPLVAPTAAESPALSPSESDTPSVLSPTSTIPKAVSNPTSSAVVPFLDSPNLLLALAGALIMRHL